MSMGLTSKRLLLRSSLLGLVLAAAGWGAGAQTTVVMASTTSTEQSGLFGHLLPAFKAATGLDVKVVALGTGQALDMGRRGDADLLFVHDQEAEEKFVEGSHARAAQLLRGSWLHKNTMWAASNPNGGNLT